MPLLSFPCGKKVLCRRNRAFARQNRAHLASGQRFIFQQRLRQRAERFDSRTQQVFNPFVRRVQDFANRALCAARERLTPNLPAPCEEKWKPLAHGALSHALPRLDAMGWEAHCEECPACAAYAAVLASWEQPLYRPPIPASLADRVVERVQREVDDTPDAFAHEDKRLQIARDLEKKRNLRTWGAIAALLVLVLSGWIVSLIRGGTTKGPSTVEESFAGITSAEIALDGTYYKTDSPEALAVLKSYLLSVKKTEGTEAYRTVLRLHGSEERKLTVNEDYTVLLADGKTLLLTDRDGLLAALGGFVS